MYHKLSLPRSVVGEKNMTVTTESGQARSYPFNT